MVDRTRTRTPDEGWIDAEQMPSDYNEYQEAMHRASELAMMQMRAHRASEKPGRGLWVAVRILLLGAMWYFAVWGLLGTAPLTFVVERIQAGTLPNGEHWIFASVLVGAAAFVAGIAASVLSDFFRALDHDEPFRLWDSYHHASEITELSPKA